MFSDISVFLTNHVSHSMLVCCIVSLLERLVPPLESLVHCLRALSQLPECLVLLSEALFLCFKALSHLRKPCSKSFGEQCALQGLPERVVSPNAAKSASLVTNVPCRPLCEGYFHQTFLNNCPVSTFVLKMALFPYGIG